MFLDGRYFLACATVLSPLVVDLQYGAHPIAIDSLVGGLRGRKQRADVVGFDHGPHRVCLVAHVELRQGVDGLRNLFGHTPFDHGRDAE